MPRYTLDRNGVEDTIETSNAVEGTDLLAQGYRVSTARSQAVRNADSENPNLPSQVAPRTVERGAGPDGGE